MPGGKLSQDLGRLDPAGPRYVGLDFPGIAWFPPRV